MDSFKWTQEEAELEKWDSFLDENPRGHFSQLSTWLKSYKAYGFDFKVLLGYEKDQIIGGLGVVIAKASIFRFYIAPYGPIVSKGFEGSMGVLLEEFYRDAKKRGATYCQANIPSVAKENVLLNDYIVNDYDDSILPKNYHIGSQFKFVSSNVRLGVVDLHYGEENSYESTALSFKSNTRRDVNKSQRIQNELVFAKTKAEIFEAYTVIQNNADTIGYAVRSWEDIKETLIAMVSNNRCLIPTCFNDGDLKGALVVFIGGRRLSYIMGATKREKKDLMVGHFLQNEMIKYSIDKQFSFYDISAGGSKGVMKFKEGFGANFVDLVGPRYWICNPLKFRVYAKTLPYLKRNKKLASKILKFFK